MKIRITIPVVRDVLMLGLGSAGLTRELFLVDTPNLIRVWVSIGLTLGPAVLLSWWRARNPLPDITPTQEQPSPSSSPLPPLG